MSQEVTKERILSEPADELTTNGTWSMDNSADGLMDELFADLDDIFDGKTKLPSEPVQPEQPELIQAVEVSQVVIPEQLVAVDIVPQKSRSSQLSRVVVDTTIVEPQPQSHQFQKKLLFGGALASSAAIGLILGLLQLGIFNRTAAPSASNPAPTQPAPSTPAQAQAQFADYIAQSLNAIDRTKPTRTAPAARPTAPTAPPVTTAAMGSVSTIPSGVSRPNILERIYIPVYQPPAPVRYALPPLPTATASAWRPAPRVAASNLARPAAKPVPGRNQPNSGRKAPNLPSVRTGGQVAVRSTPNLPPAPKVINRTATPTTPRRVTPAPQQSLPAPRPQYAPTVPPPPPMADAPVAQYAPTSSHKLVGLLSMGNNSSAALFEIQGVTRRFQVGEAIGDSGWTLVDVTKGGEVVIRRNGEVRSVAPGIPF